MMFGPWSRTGLICLKQPRLRPIPSGALGRQASPEPEKSAVGGVTRGGGA